jgi:hypothetical protein
LHRDPQIVVVATASVDDTTRIEFACALAGKHERDVGQIVAVGTVAPAFIPRMTELLKNAVSP